MTDVQEEIVEYRQPQLRLNVDLDSFEESESSYSYSEENHNQNAVEANNQFNQSPIQNQEILYKSKAILDLDPFMDKCQQPQEIQNALNVVQGEGDQHKKQGIQQQPTFPQMREKIDAQNQIEEDIKDQKIQQCKKENNKTSCSCNIQ